VSQQLNYIIIAFTSHNQAKEHFLSAITPRTTQRSNLNPVGAMNTFLAVKTARE